MSDKTLERLEAAIAEHVNDEWGEQRVLTDWVFIAAHFGLQPDTTGYQYGCSDSSPHSLMGLTLKLANVYSRDNYRGDE